MIRVWSDSLKAGLLEKHGARGSAFAYEEQAASERAVSMTMPVRLASWNQDWGIHPIFEMNLPEGYLRERLRLGFAKAAGNFDDLDLLAVVGRSQIGRLRYTDADADLQDEVPFQSVDEILKHRRDGDLFSAMMDRFAAYSGIAGVQPKVMIRDETDLAPGRESLSIRGATHIVKFWEERDYPHLAANEYFCLLAAEKAGLTVPRRRLSEDASALVVDRFDLQPNGRYAGLEDFCVLNGKGTEKKYEGGYETSLFRRAGEFLHPTTHHDELARLFALFVLNAALRNGDAHLKNYALIYETVSGMPKLADVYDIVTTTVYFPQDKMALTLNGRPNWPTVDQLAKLGTVRCGLAPAEVRNIFDRTAAGITDALAEMRHRAGDYAGFLPVARSMEQQWRDGMIHSLGLGS